MFSPDADNPWGSRVRLKPAGPHTFRMVGGPSSGELLKFELDSSGHVVRLIADNYYVLRHCSQRRPIYNSWRRARCRT